MNGLYPKILLLVGGVFTAALTAAVVCLSVAQYQWLRRSGLAGAAWTDLALDTLLILLMALCGGLLALGLLTFYGLRRLVIKPLRTIQDAAAAIGRGELDHRLRVHSGDE